MNFLFHSHKPVCPRARLFLSFAVCSGPAKNSGQVPGALAWGVWVQPWSPVSVLAVVRFFCQPGDMVVTMLEKACFVPGSSGSLRSRQTLCSGPGWERGNHVSSGGRPPGAGSIEQCVAQGHVLTHSGNTNRAPVMCQALLLGARDTAREKARSLASWDLRCSGRDRK